MSINQQHIQDWMQQSAELGFIPVDEWHWQQMKDLLQKKKKRRILFWWWFLGGMIGLGLGVLGVRSLNKINKVSEEKVVVERVYKEGLVDKKIESSSNKSNKEKENTVAKTDTVKTFAIAKIDIEKLKIDIEKKNATIKKQQTKIVKQAQVKKEDADLADAKTITIDYKRIVPTTPIAIDKDSFEISKTTTISTENKVEAKVISVKGDSSIDNKDSNSIVKQVDTTKSSSIKPSTPKQKNKLFYSVGLATRLGNAPIPFSLISLHPAIHIPISKNITINGSAGLGYGFKYEAQRFKNLVSFSPIQGTILYRVDSLTINFKPQNNFLFTPKISLGFVGKKLNTEFGVGFQKALSTNTQILSTKGDTNFIQLPPTQPRPTAIPFTNNAYSGSQAWFVETTIGYMLHKNWEINVGLQYLLQTNNVPNLPVSSNNKLNLNFGIRKYFKRK